MTSLCGDSPGKKRGIKQANNCIVMSAIAYNLKKLLKWQQRKIKTEVMGLKNTGQGVCFCFFKLWTSILPHKRMLPIFIFH